jgi:hypothetical protein
LTACNFGSFTDTDNSLCIYADGNCEICEGGTAVNQDADGDGVCDGDEIVGCQDAAACNYSASATDAGSCIYADGNCEICEGGSVVVQDADGDGVCDGDEITGCQDSAACNYDATATDPGTCIYADGNCEICEGGTAITQDADGDGVCDGDEIVGCQDSTACNYDAAATDPGTCDYITCTEQPEGCEADLNQSGTVGVDDLLMLLAEFGCTGNCPVDVDGDGVTGVTDILLLLSSFGIVSCATGG